MSDLDDSRLNGRGAFLAAEYALGIASAEERRAAERRIAEDSTFAAEVARWHGMLQPMADLAAPVRPPASLWTRIERAIEAEAATLAHHTRPARRLWQSLAFWRGFAFGSLGLAAASVGALALVLPDFLSSGDKLAEVSAQAGRHGPAGIIAAFNPRARTLLIVPAAPSASQQWVPELWLILPTGVPRSLGVVDPEQPTEVRLPADLAAQASPASTLAISLEPPGGSPTGSPTGPVIAEGTLRRL